MDDDEELLVGRNPVQWNTGGEAGSIRYYRDADDRVTAAYAGDGAGAATYDLSPAGNPVVTSERSRP